MRMQKKRMSAYESDVESHISIAPL
jgi:hypothetical protein